MIALALVTPLLLPLIFGGDFAPAVTSAQILVVAAASLGLGLVLEDTLRGLGDTPAVLKSEGVGLAFTLVALAILLPRFGIVGAAIASLLGYTATTAVLVRFVSRHVGCAPLSVVVPTAAETGLLWRRARAALQLLDRSDRSDRSDGEISRLGSGGGDADDAGSRGGS
jgi:O-antigen/teichoic acid export membrane protein